MPNQDSDQASIPPRWFVRTAWSAHRGLYRVTGGRFGLRRPTEDKWGMMRLTTIGRRTGQERSVILAYFEDGHDVVTMAMNGWAEADPAWWLNLQTHPEAIVNIDGDSRTVRGRSSEGDERERLWALWGHLDENLEGYAANRSGETAIVVLEPSSGPDG